MWMETTTKKNNFSPVGTNKHTDTPYHKNKNRKKKFQLLWLFGGGDNDWNE